MAKPKSIYVVDTCSFTTLQRAYSIDVFPSVWRKVEELILDGKIVSVDEVYHEICRQDDDLSKWAKIQQGIFLPLSDEVQDQAKEIVNNYIKIVDFKNNKSGADPFVIAQAVLLSGTVVTEEKHSGGQEKMKIPDVCDALKLPYMNFMNMMKAEGLRF